MPGPIPTIDVTEADRRLREDPDAILLDVREMQRVRRRPGSWGSTRPDL